MLPKQIYVYETKDGDVAYLNACRELDEIPEDEANELVGTYELKTRSKFIVTRSLQNKKQASNEDR